MNRKAGAVVISKHDPECSGGIIGRSPKASIIGCAAVALVLGCSGPRAQQQAADWPQWRGPSSRGLAASGPLPSTWSADSSNVRWRTKLPGAGNSSPIVVGDRVFLTTAHYADRDDGIATDEPDNSDGPEEVDGLDRLTEQDDDEAEESHDGVGVATRRGRTALMAQRQMWRTVIAVDLASGEVLWSRDLFLTPSGRLHHENTAAAATPAARDGRVFAYFGSHLASLDYDGNVLWQLEVEPNHAVNTRYGAASSPALSRSSVIVFQDQEWADAEEVGWLAAYDQRTGEPKWRTEWDDSCCSYSTPLVVDRGTGEEVLVAHSGRIASYSATTGEKLWQHPYLINQMIGTPVVDGDLVLIAGGANNVKSTLVLRLTGAGRSTTVDELWSSQRLVPENSSPLLYEDKLFTVTDRAVVAAHHPTTGELLWQHRLGFGRTRASLVGGDGKIYAVSTSGWVTVFRSSDQFELVAENYLDDEGTNASPAIAGGCLILRTRSYLACIAPEAGAAAAGN